MTSVKTTTAKVLTANDLLGGHVVFFTEDRKWSADLQDAWLATTTQAAADFETLAASREVEAKTASAYVMEVRHHQDGSLETDKLREEIRVAGPTIEIVGSGTNQST